VVKTVTSPAKSYILITPVCLPAMCIYTFTLSSQCLNLCVGAPTPALRKLGTFDPRDNLVNPTNPANLSRRGPKIFSRGEFSTVPSPSEEAPITLIVCRVFGEEETCAETFLLCPPFVRPFFLRRFSLSSAFCVKSSVRSKIS